MPIVKKFEKKKVVKKVNPNSGMSKGEWNKMQADKMRAAKQAAKDKVDAARAKSAKIALAKAAVLVGDETFCRDLTPDSKPKLVSRVVAKALGIPNKPEKLPKEILPIALKKMPDVEVDGSLLPKEALLLLAAVIAERKAAKDAIEHAKRQEKAAAAEVKRQALAVAEAEKEAKRQAAYEAEQALLAAAAEPEAELQELGADIPDMRSGEVVMMGMTDKQKKRAAKKAAKMAAAGIDASVSKGAAKAAAKRAKMGESVARARAQLAEDLKNAALETARLRSAMGGRGFSLTSIESGIFNLANPGGGADLLEDAEFTLVPGRRYGLIGRNGKGKSTLLKAVAARKQGGVDPAISIHYINQELQLSEEQEQWVPLQVVLLANIERCILQTEVADLEAVENPTAEQAERIDAIHERLALIGSESANARAEALLVGLGFSDALRKRKMCELSGGWRVRVMLAAGLFAEPDILLLDEPTNHLSIDAVLWLQNQLATCPTWEDKIMITVSHDRTFLDEVCTDMLHVSGVSRKLTQNRGSYSVWSTRRKGQQKAWTQAKLQRKMKIDHLLEFIHRGSGYANVLKQMAMKQAQVDKLREEEAQEMKDNGDLLEDEELPLRLLAGGRLDMPAVNIQDVSFRYPSTPGKKMLLEHVEMCVTGDSRICLLGENGQGKTTLVNLIMGKLDASKGLLKREPGARIALVSQHHADQIDLDQTPLAFLQQCYPGDGTSEHNSRVRGHLTSCGVSERLQSTPASALSGGQRSRVAMAMTSFGRPHVLILDEPTNNLDLEAVEALAEAVNAFDGGVVLVSHDAWFVNAVAKEIWVVDKGRVAQQESMKAYMKMVSKQLAKAEAARRSKKVGRPGH